MQESNTPTNNPLDPTQDPDGMCIDINQLHDHEFDASRLKDIVRQILMDHEQQAAEISIAIVTDERIHQLNRQYLQHDYETDVLSFDLSEETDSRLVGEIIVSADTAARCAAEHQVGMDDELALYVIHGVLHLVGYDDKVAELRVSMREAEKRYAGSFGIQYCSPDESSDAMDGAC